MKASMVLAWATAAFTCPRALSVCLDYDTKVFLGAHSLVFGERSTADSVVNQIESPANLLKMEANVYVLIHCLRDYV